MKKLGFLATVLMCSHLISLNAVAAQFQCFEFVRKEFASTPEVEVKLRSIPSIVELTRVLPNGQISKISQEIIPLNEAVDNLLLEMKTGEHLCLKGTKGVVAPRKFFAYEAYRKVLSASSDESLRGRR